MSLLAPSIAAVVIAAIAALCFLAWLRTQSTGAKWARALESRLRGVEDMVARFDLERRKLVDELGALGDKVASELSRRRPPGT